MGWGWRMAEQQEGGKWALAAKPSECAGHWTPHRGRQPAIYHGRMVETCAAAALLRMLAPAAHGWLLVGNLPPACHASCPGLASARHRAPPRMLTAFTTAVTARGSACSPAPHSPPPDLCHAPPHDALPHASPRPAPLPNPKPPQSSSTTAPAPTASPAACAPRCTRGRGQSGASPIGLRCCPSGRSCGSSVSGAGRRGWRLGAGKAPQPGLRC